MRDRREYTKEEEGLPLPNFPAASTAKKKGLKNLLPPFVPKTTDSVNCLTLRVTPTRYAVKYLLEILGESTEACLKEKEIGAKKNFACLVGTR